jgi:outer membrane protein
VARQSLALAEKLYGDNKKQVDIGTMAPIEILNAEAQVESRRADLVNAEGTIRTQETNLKNLLSRNGIAGAAIADIHIVPTDRITVPDLEPVQPVQDLVATALRNRPELAQQQIQMDNTRINLTGTRNSMLPQLNLVGSVSNPASGGTLNPAPNINPQTLLEVPRNVNRDLVGGYTNILRQLFLVPTVNYSIAFQLNIPLRNRAAQAQMAQQQLQLRQAELNYQKQTNQIRVDVQNAQIAIEQARARFQAAQKSRSLQEQVLEAEEKKLQLGASTVFQVIQYQNNLASARQTEVQAQVQYATAKNQLDMATASLMDKYNIVFDEAREGTVNRRPDPIPVVLNTNGQAANATPAVVTPR